MSEKLVVKKVPRKTVRKAATKVTSAKKVPRKTVRKAATTSSGMRKAPTPIAFQTAADKQSRLILIVGGIFAAMLVVIGVVIGFSDKGVINVSETVSERMKGASEAEKRELERVGQVEKNRNVIDGGLLPSDDQTQLIREVPTTASSSASSTETTASSSEAVVGEGENDSTLLSTTEATSSEVMTASSTDVIE